MNHIVGYSVVFGLGVAALLNVAALLVMRYAWTWKRVGADSISVAPTDGLKSGSSAIIKTAYGELETTTLSLEDLLPFRGVHMPAQAHEGHIYVRNNFVVLGLGVWWGIAKAACIASLCFIGWWLVGGKDVYVASAVIGSVVALPAWGVLLAVGLYRQEELMAAYSGVLKKAMPHNKSLQRTALTGRR